MKLKNATVDLMLTEKGFLRSKGVVDQPKPVVPTPAPGAAQPNNADANTKHRSITCPNACCSSPNPNFPSTYACSNACTSISGCRKGNAFTDEVK